MFIRLASRCFDDWLSIFRNSKRTKGFISTVFITGTNRGIGLALAREYLKSGWTVYATHRETSDSSKLRSLKGDLKRFVLDVTDLPGTQKLAQKLKDVPLDVVIASAGVMHPIHGIETLDTEGWLNLLKVNTIGCAITAHCFLPNLLAGKQKKLVAITSRMGSIDDNTSGGYIPYRSSKAALNMTWKSIAVDLKPKRVIATVFHPGWVKTDMGGPNAEITTDVSVKGLTRHISKLAIKDSGKFYSYQGELIPW